MAKSIEAYDKLVASAATAEGVEDKEEYTRMLETGKKTLAAFTATTNKEDVKKYIHSLAVDSIEEWDRRKAEEKLRRKAERAGMTLDEYNEKQRNQSKIAKLAKAMVSIPGAIIAIPATLVQAGNRAFQLNKYKKIIQQSVDKNAGNLAAGSIAADIMLNGNYEQNRDIQKTVQEKLEEGAGKEFNESLLGRAEAKIAAGEESEDEGVRFIEANQSSFAETRTKKNEELTSEEKKRQAIAKYTEKIAGAKEGANDQYFAKARKDLMDSLAAIDGSQKSINNYEKIADNIAHNLTGALSSEWGSRKTTKKHQKAIAAIDKYLDQTITLSEAKVSTGLAAKDVYNKIQDKSILNYGVIIGLGVSLGASLVTSLARSEAVKLAAGSPLVRFGVAAIIGGVKGYNNEKRKQTRENIRRATKIGEDKQDDLFIEASMNKKGKLTQYSILNSKVIAEQMRDLIGDDGKLKDADKVGEDGKTMYEHAIWKIAEIRLRNQKQNQEGLQLISFQGEKQKLEMFKAINELKRAIHATKEEKSIEELNREIEAMIQESTENGSLHEFEEVKKQQRIERWKVAGKTALIAGGTTLAFSYLAGKINALRAPKAQAQVGQNVAPGEGGSGEAPQMPFKGEIERNPGQPAAVLIENNAEGGVNVAVDVDGDGIIDPEEVIRSGANLTNQAEYLNLRDELENQYNVLLEREAIDVGGYQETTVGEYLAKVGNTVDNSGGVDWSKSANLASFGNPSLIDVDGADVGNYAVPVWGFGGSTVPEGAKLFIDLDGSGPGRALEFAIRDGQAIVPADVLDVSNLGEGGAASFIGVVRVGEMNGSSMISYATAIGSRADLSTVINAATSESGYAFTAIDKITNEKLSQFAVDGNGTTISNLSEIFKGIAVGESDRIPSVFSTNDMDGNSDPIRLANGAEIKELDYRDGYHEEFDSFHNRAFVQRKTYLGTPMEYDFNGDGAMSPEEQAKYLTQMFVKTGTDPYVLGQNASNYGLLEPDRLESIIPKDVLKDWGITDGIVDSEKELNLLLDHLKERTNADYYDRLVNETINEMGAQIDGGSIEIRYIADRMSTYCNSNGQLDTASSGIKRVVILLKDKEGKPIGNKGWWARKYGAEGGEVYDMPLCDQKCVGGSTPVDPTPVKPTPVKPTPVIPEDPVNPEDPINPTPTPTPTPTPLEGKGANANAGPGAQVLDETPLRQDVNYVEATPENHVDPSVPAGSEVTGGDASVYSDNVVPGPSGTPQTDAAGNIYITNPDGSQTAEEVAQNIADGTQTTYSPDITDWEAGAQSDVPVTVNPVPQAGEVMQDSAAANVGGSVPSTGTPSYSGGGSDSYYTQDQLAEMFRNNFINGGS